MLESSQGISLPIVFLYMYLYIPIVFLYTAFLFYIPVVSQKQDEKAVLLNRLFLLAVYRLTYVANILFKF